MQYKKGEMLFIVENILSFFETFHTLFSLHSYYSFHYFNENQ